MSSKIRVRSGVRLYLEVGSTAWFVVLELGNKLVETGCTKEGENNARVSNTL